MKKREFIVQDLLSKIYQEEFSAGKLPNQRTLAQTYGVSRFTIQQAIKNLEEIGIVKVVQGSGIFIHEKWVKNPMIFNSLTRTPYDRIHSKMISLNKAAATLDEQQIFQIGSDEEVWTFERVRIVNYKIEQLETSKLPVSPFPELTQEIVEHSIPTLCRKLRIPHFPLHHKLYPHHHIDRAIGYFIVQAGNTGNADQQSGDFRRRPRV